MQFTQLSLSNFVLTIQVLSFSLRFECFAPPKAVYRKQLPNSDIISFLFDFLEHFAPKCFECSSGSPPQGLIAAQRSATPMFEYAC